jgi:nitrogen-specific signal transduction histidine kinase
VNPQPALFICSRDEALVQRLRAGLGAELDFRVAADVRELERALEPEGPSLLVLDLRTREAQEFLARHRRARPSDLVIALGDLRSDPLLEAAHAGVYAAEPMAIEPDRLQNTALRALDQLRLAEEVERLRTEVVRAGAPAEAPQLRPERLDSPRPLRHFAPANRHFADLGALMERIVEGLASASVVTRAGLFARTKSDPVYRLRAGLRCLEETSQAGYAEGDPLPRWLERNAHLVAGTTVGLLSDAAARRLLGTALHAMGAEVIAPLLARGRLLGWLFIGCRSTGLPFDYADLEDVSTAAEHVATLLENASLYEEVALQKTLAETLLHTLPTGVIAADAEGVVRWFSTSAEALLGIKALDAIGQPAEVLGSRLADLLRRAIRGDMTDFPRAWTDPQTRKAIFVQSRTLSDGSACLGAVVMLQDMTAQKALQEKQEQLERAAFWTELAASMSHEIRNPLVAIKTFAQLLPERYRDSEFRGEFSKVVTHEIGRLDQIIKQIDDFAHPPELRMQPLDIRAALKKGLESALPPSLRSGIRIAASVDEDLPQILGDEKALADCFAHIFRNSAEALAHQKNPEIEVTARRTGLGNGNGNGNGHSHGNGRSESAVSVVVRDNGRGMPPEILEKVFSPFCTTKARGMGLGLPIVKRTIVDHNGRVNVESSDQGTSVAVVLPAAEQGERYEKAAHRR